MTGRRWWVESVSRISGWWFGTDLLSSRQKVALMRAYCLATGGHRWIEFPPLADGEVPGICAKCAADKPADRPDMQPHRLIDRLIYRALYGLAWVVMRVLGGGGRKGWVP